METPIYVAIISVAGGLMTAGASYLLNKRQERNAEWRKLKLAKYEELLAATSELANDETSGQRFARAANDVDLVASPDVLVALRSFLDPIVKPPPSGLTAEHHDGLFTALMSAIRRDLGIKGAIPDGFRLRLWRRGKPREADADR